MAPPEIITKRTSCTDCKPPKKGESKKLLLLNYKNIRLLQKLSTPQGKQ